MNNKISLVVDGNYLMFQSFYATYYGNPEGILRNKAGVPTNGISVFLTQLSQLIKEFQPDNLFIAFDAKEKTKRHEQYEGYKDGRTKAPSELFIQFKLIKELLTKLNIKHQEVAGFEADDLIAAYCKNIPGQKYIFSHDRDLMQLINEDVSVINKVKKGFSAYYDLIDIYNFEDIFGYPYQHVIDYKALKGDSSDNLPGVKGIGDKTAIDLIYKFGTFDNIYKNINSDQITNAVRNKLKNGEATGRMCYDLTVLNPDIADFNTDTNFYHYHISFDNAVDMFNELELNKAKKAIKDVAW
ncbi:5'-3' exonuclease [Mycoplasma hafezii]|uniref:5'-3' exonuclease n=1 Tax=Mycoplasma hafezii TaxID=525886 RepID=UPI003CEA5804